MDNQKLDNILKKAKDQSERFFAGWNDKLTPQTVQQRCREREKPWKRRLDISNIKMGAAFACVLLLLAAAFQFAGEDTPLPASGPFTSTPVYPVNQEGYLSWDHPVFSLLLTKDFIPKGSLGIQGGVLVEQSPQGVVTKIIPYRFNRRGELVLPADRVLLQVGEDLLLIGIDLPHHVEAGEADYYLQKINEENIGFISQTRFRVHSPGEEWLQIIPSDNSTELRSIYIKIID